MSSLGLAHVSRLDSGRLVLASPSGRGAGGGGARRGARETRRPRRTATRARGDSPRAARPALVEGARGQGARGVASLRSGRTGAGPPAGAWGWGAGGVGPRPGVWRNLALQRRPVARHYAKARATPRLSIAHTCPRRGRGAVLGVRFRLPDPFDPVSRRRRAHERSRAFRSSEAGPADATPKCKEHEEPKREVPAKAAHDGDPIRLHRILE